MANMSFPKTSAIAANPVATMANEVRQPNGTAAHANPMDGTLRYAARLAASGGQREERALRPQCRGRPPGKISERFSRHIRRLEQGMVATYGPAIVVYGPIADLFA